MHACNAELADAAGQNVLCLHHWMGGTLWFHDGAETCEILEFLTWNYVINLS